MNVEFKYNYNGTHAGKLWAGELNMVVKELLNIFKSFVTPNATKTDQVLTGINYLTMYNLWYTEILDDEFTLFRRNDLPTPDYVLGLHGDILIQTTNNVDNPYIRFIGKDPIRLRLHGEELVMNQLQINQVYKFVVQKDQDGLYMNLLNLSVKTDTIVSGNSGYVVTIPPTEIINNRIQLPDPVRGDIILNVCHAYTVNEDGSLSNEYDTKRVRVDTTDKTVAIIVDDGDGIDVNGRYGVLSYSK